MVAIAKTTPLPGDTILADRGGVREIGEILRTVLHGYGLDGCGLDARPARRAHLLAPTNESGRITVRA